MVRNILKKIFPYIHSLVLHIGILELTYLLSQWVTNKKDHAPVKKMDRVKITIVDKQIEKKVETTIAKEELKPQAPTPTLAKKKKPPPTKEIKKVKKIKKVFGLKPSAVSTTTEGPGLAVPVGNTLLMEDDGQRVAPEKIEPLVESEDIDLSQPAKLMPESVKKPQYTDEAQDVQLQGVYTLDVFVDETGRVKEAKLRKKVGFGMDHKLELAALEAQFEPRKDRNGKSLSTWTSITFELTLD